MDANLTALIATMTQKSYIAGQVATAVAVKTREMQQKQGDSAVELVQQAAALSEQIALGSVDVEL